MHPPKTFKPTGVKSSKFGTGNNQVNSWTHKWPYKRPQCLLSNKLPLYDAKILLIDLTDAPYENYSIILGISKKDQNHIVHSVSCLIDKALHVLSCTMLSLKEGQTNDGNTLWAWILTSMLTDLESDMDL